MARIGHPQRPSFGGHRVSAPEISGIKRGIDFFNFTNNAGPSLLLGEQWPLANQQLKGDAGVNFFLLGSPLAYDRNIRSFYGNDAVRSLSISLWVPRFGKFHLDSHFLCR